MTSHRRSLQVSIAVLTALVLLPLTFLADVRAAETEQAVLPAYDADGRLLLPENYREWIYVGSSLGLSYSEGGGGMEMFHHTLMEPTAYRYFKATGEFREGTMLLLSLHGQGEGVLPQRRGRFENEVHGVEMAVKDSGRFERGWAYFGFGGMNGVRDRAEAIGSDSCNDCHSEHAAYDNVFLQFYPSLAEVAPEGSPAQVAFASLKSAGVEESRAASNEEAATEGVLALGGLDPVLLTEGREELGKPEIVERHGLYVYQFISEPTRARFAGEPERYSIQNKTCPVAPGTPTDPALFTVHEGKIYTFATARCIEEFRANPAAFLPAD